MRLGSLKISNPERIIFALLAVLALAIALVTVPQLVKRNNPTVATAAVSPLGIFEVTSQVSPTTLPAGGGTVKLSYTITNKSGHDLYYVRENFNGCSPKVVEGSGGEYDSSGQLFLKDGNSVTVSCETKVTQTTDLYYTPTWAYQSNGTWYSDSATVTDKITVETGNLSCDVPWFTTFRGDSLGYNNFGTVNTATGAMDPKFQIWNARGYGSSGMGVDPTNPQYAYWSSRNGDSAFFNDLWRTDLTTGVRTNLGISGKAFSSSRMAVDGNGTVWTFSDDSKIYRLDNANSVPAGGLNANPGLVKNLGTPRAKLPDGTSLSFSSLQSGDIAFDGSGTMWILAAASSGITWLLTIGPEELSDPTGIDATVVGQMPQPGQTNPPGVGSFYLGLAFDTQGTLYANSVELSGSKRTSLFSLNKDTGAATLIGTSSGAGGVGDLGSCALPAPKLVVEKSAAPSVVRPGDTITYRIEMKNVANLTATGVKFQDAIPNGTTYVANSAKLNGKPVADVNGASPWLTDRPVNGSTTDRPGLIPAGDKAVIEFQVKLPENTSLSEVVNQGVANFTGNTNPIPTDDPTLSGATDETRVKVAQPRMKLTKRINGNADTTEQNPEDVGARDKMNVEFEVENTGDILLEHIKVTDDIIKPDTEILAPSQKIPASGGTATFDGTLAPGEKAIYTASWWPEPPLHHNVATVTANPPAKPGGESPTAISATDDAWAKTPSEPGFTLVKKINGSDANDTPINVAPGSTMEVAFEVTNTGNGPLKDFIVEDDKISAGDITAPTQKRNVNGQWVPFDGTLRPGEFIVFTATYPAPTESAKNHQNTAKVTATGPVVDGAAQPVEQTDIAKAHTPAEPAVTMRKYINDDDADSAPGVRVIPGTSMDIKFEVTNTGTSTLKSLTVTDYEGAATSGDGKDVPPPATKFTASGAEVPWNGSLEPGEKAFLITTVAAPTPGTQHTDTAVVNAKSFDGTTEGKDVTDQDSANAYVPGIPSMKVVKQIDGQDGETSPGVETAADSTMNVTFEVINDGSTDLENVTLADDTIPTHLISVPTSKTTTDGTEAPFEGTLSPGEKALFTASFPTPVLGQIHHNTATVTGNPTADQGGNIPPQISATDSAYAYTPGVPQLELVKKVNGEVATEAPGPVIKEGSDVTFTFEVTNRGTTTVKDINLTDDTLAADSIKPKSKMLADGTEVTFTDDNTFDGILAPGESVIYEAKDTAPAERDQEHKNVATVTGTSVKADGTDGEAAESKAEAHFRTPGTGKLEIVKKINGEDANTEDTSAFVEPGTEAKFTFEVKNTGTIRVNNVYVTDTVIPEANITWPEKRSPQGCADDSCQLPFEGWLDPGDTAVYTASLWAPGDKGQKHHNEATVVGVPAGEVDTTVSASDEVYANTGKALEPGISVIKRINSDDANTEPGVEVTPGAEMNISIEIANTGEAPLTDVTVTDTVIPADRIVCDSGTNIVNKLEPQSRTTCTASVTAPITPGQLHGNVANVFAKVEGSKDTIVGNDVAFAFVPPAQPPLPTPKNPSVLVKKQIDGEDADTVADAVQTTAGQTMSITFLVTNDGDTDLKDVKVTDEVVGGTKADICTIDSLAVGQTAKCETTATAPDAGNTHLDIAKVEGTPVDDKGEVLVDENGAPLPLPRNEDPAFAVTPADPAAPGSSAISVVKKINGEDGSVYPGVKLAEGEPLNVTFTVKNEGTTTLAGVKLTDSVLGDITCDQDTLTAGMSMECTGLVPALNAGENHTNVATVTATPEATDENPTPTPVTASDVSNAFVPQAPGTEPEVKNPAISIDMKINGQDGPIDNPVKANAGDKLEFTFTVKNTGDVPLTDVKLNDNMLGDVKCDKTELAVGEEMTCSATYTMPEGQGWLSLNVVTVTGTAPDGTTKVTDNDTGYISPKPVSPEEPDKPNKPNKPNPIWILLPILIPLPLLISSNFPGSSTPGTPGVPGKPGKPGKPDKPGDSGEFTPNKPGQPSKPGQPTPGEEQQPGQPGQSGQSGAPDSAAQPSMQDKARGFLASTSASPWGPVLIGLVVVALAALLVFIIRRGRNKGEDTELEG